VSLTGGYRVKAVNCTGGELPGSRGYQHATAVGQLLVLAGGVPVNTCFKLNWLNDSWFHGVSGSYRISY